MRRYTVVLTPDVEDGGYVVTVPTLPGLVTEGDTLEEALDMARDAIIGWIATLAERGEPIPEEQAAPELAAVEV